MFIKAAVNIPLDTTFTYAVPAEFEEKIAVGRRVLVPFGKKSVTGYILSTMDEPDREEVKTVSAILDDEPIFNEGDLAFYRWASDYYLYPIGKLLREVLPGGIDSGSSTWVSLVPVQPGAAAPAGREPTRREPTRRETNGMAAELIRFLQACPAVPLKKLKEAFAGKRIEAPLKRLRDTGRIVLEERIEGPQIAPRKVRYVIPASGTRPESGAGFDAVLKPPTPAERKLLDFLGRVGEAPAARLSAEFKNAGAMIRALRGKGLVAIQEREVMRDHGQEGIGSAGRPTLNPDQEAACRALAGALHTGRFAPFLLHGVTGSGKTEVYFRAIQEVLDREGTAMYLVPEIALTPQLLGRIGERFAGRRIALLHSGVSASARYDQWRRIARGEIDIVIGARSAVFAPARRLRLVVVDEEHDASYKQDDRMRYNARDLAVVKAQLEGCAVVLGSATPGIQSFHHALNGKYGHLHLPRRVEDRTLPAVTVVDMRTEIDPEGRPRLVSRPLAAAIGETLDRGKQTILFLNRRGFHTFVCCFSCGHQFKCLNCSVSLTHHAAEGVLRCHYCDFTLKALPVCPVCGNSRIGTYGMGTEKLEKEIAERFPQARIQRMDSDTTAGRGEHGRILRRLDRGEVDILIGTQMIAKGHDYPNVLLVGVISADTALSLPDFRATERTFQMLTQVSGRGGRGADPGRVLIQTFNPDHEAVRLAALHNFRGFYESEIGVRQAFSYPPFTRLVNVQISSNVAESARAGAAEIGRTVRRLANGAVEVMGPAEAPIARIKGRYRWQVLLKGTSAALNRLAREVLRQRPHQGITVKVDVDPLNFM